MSELKIEAGKSYKSRDGKKAFVGYEREDGMFVGHLVKSGVVLVWKPDGQQVHKVSVIEKWVPGFDLISEWKEPRKGEVWVNVYAESDGAMCLFAHDSREEADGHADDDERLACVGPIPWTEGQGLPDNGSGE